jgi:hypothetical protein
MQKDFRLHLFLNRDKYRQVQAEIAPKALAVFLCFVTAGLLAYLFFLQIRINSLQLEKNHWQTLLAAGEPSVAGCEIPTEDRLPAIIELCQASLSKNSIMVTSFNVERFAEKKEAAAGPALDYASIRIHFLGKWTDAEAGISELEHLNNLVIHVQEVALTPAGGETLLRIYLLNN